jgi:cell division protein ZipA
MIIIGVLLLIIVLLDGIRRMRAERRDHIRVAFKMGGGVYDEAAQKTGKTGKSGDVLGEARVVDREDRIEPSISDAETVEGDYADDELPVVTEAVAPVQVVEEEDPITVAVREQEHHRREQDSAEDINENVDEVIVINVLSKNVDGFNGADLMQIMLACDMRFGKRNIFHRHEQKNGTGPIQFSMANLVEPGIFDLNVIENFHTPGVCFFLTLPGPDDPLKAFDYMVETANVLVNNLNGELKDEAHSAVTAQTLAHHRQRVQEFERRKLTMSG